MAPWVKEPHIASMRLWGLIPSLTQWVKDPALPQAAGVGRRCSLDLVVLWLAAGSGSSDVTASLGTSMCLSCGLKKNEERERERERETKAIPVFMGHMV